MQERDDLGTAEALLAARQNLGNALIGSGWQPPAQIQDQVYADAALLDVPLGALERLNHVPRG
jgi:hypothetical protein